MKTTAHKLNAEQVNAAEDTIQESQENELQIKTEEARDKSLKSAGYRRSRPAYELGIGSGFGRMSEGTLSSVVEGTLQVLAPIAVMAAVGFGTGLIPVPMRAGATCSD